MLGEHNAKGLEGVRLLNVNEAARLLGTTPGSLYSMVWRREVPFVKLGRSLRFDINDLNALIEASKFKPDELVGYRGKE
jgi:excisionase family DNA binding protein